MKSTNKLLIALGIGAAAGTIAGILLAPRKGTETRKLIADKGSKLGQGIRNGIQGGRRKLTTMTEDLEASLNHVGKKIEEVL